VTPKTPLTPEQHALVTSCIPYVYKVVISYIRRRPFLQKYRDDLVQEGCLGLMHAAGKYQTGRGATYLTYARAWVKYYVEAATHTLPEIVKAPGLAGGGWRASMTNEGSEPLDAAVFSVAEDPVEALALRDLREHVRTVLTSAGMTPKTVAQYDAYTFEEERPTDIGRRYGVSRQRVQQRVRQAQAVVDEWAATVRREAA
jgi:RNA polymerase sigma factor (sigma-70 family)